MLRQYNNMDAFVKSYDKKQFGIYFLTVIIK